MKKGAVKKKYPKVEKAILYIFSTFENTILTLAQKNGDVLTQVSPAQCGFKNCKKNTPHAVQKAFSTMGEKAKENYGVKSIKIIVRGAGMARDYISSIQSYALIEGIEDRTMVPYGGCRRAGAPSK